jgi:hypothetical protein
MNTELGEMCRTRAVIYTPIFSRTGIGQGLGYGQDDRGIEIQFPVKVEIYTGLPRRPSSAAHNVCDPPYAPHRMDLSYDQGQLFPMVSCTATEAAEI